MASNTDEKAKSFLVRLIRLEEERRTNAEDRKELGAEMKSAELLKEEVAGIKLAVKRHFETDEKRMFRESADEFAVALGEFKDTPLGDAAIRHVKNDPRVRRAAKDAAKFKAELDRLGATMTVSRAPRDPNAPPDIGSKVADRLVAMGATEV